MTVWKNTLIAGAVALAALALPAMAQTASRTGTTTLSVTVPAEASLVVNTATTTLTQAVDVGMFGNFTGTTNFTYKIRTTLVGGTGSVTSAVAAFAAGGPTVATDLKYNSTTGGLGTAVTAQAASTTTAPVITGIGANAHSAAAGNAGTVVWTLTDSPVFATGTYTSIVTFTIAVT